MRVLITGASSFTGYWFARTLAAGGHHVLAGFTAGSPDDYTGIRRDRVRKLMTVGEPAFGLRFGEPGFLALLRSGRPDILCHHAAEVSDYRSEGFDVVRALESNTRELPRVLDTLLDTGGGSLVVTGSVFEQDEGAGSDDPRAFSLYGLSKGLTWQVFRYWAERKGVRLGTFVVPNPFGPFEEPRFTAYLMTTWLSGGLASVKTPRYVRDNIHVELLARAYRRFVEITVKAPAGTQRLFGPSGYVMSQGDFVAFAAERMRPLLGRPCLFTLEKQPELSEPLARANGEPAAGLVPDWDEDAAWRSYATYYQTR